MNGSGCAPTGERSDARAVDARELLRVYVAVRRAGHGWWRALRCCNDARRGSWSARDAGEMRAQLVLMLDAIR